MTFKEFARPTDLMVVGHHRRQFSQSAIMMGDKMKYAVVMEYKVNDIGKKRRKKKREKRRRGSTLIVFANMDARMAGWLMEED